MSLTTADKLMSSLVSYLLQQVSCDLKIDVLKESLQMSYSQITSWSLCTHLIWYILWVW